MSSIIFTILPSVPATLLLLLTIYHLLPLLPLLTKITLPNFLIDILPSPLIPRRNTLLPREFFNLPPRSDEDLSIHQTSSCHRWRSRRSTTLSSRLGVRGCIMALLLIQSILSLSSGWAYISRSHDKQRWGVLVAISITTLPSTVLSIALGMLQPKPNTVLAKMLGTKITHSTVFKYTCPFSLCPTFVIAIIASQLPNHSIVLVATSSVLTLACVVAIGAGWWRVYKHQHEPHDGVIRRSSPSPNVADEKVAASQDLLDRLRPDSDWLTSPSQNGASPVSSFSYPSSVQTPRPKPKSTTVNGSPTSWLSSPTNSPNSIPEWSYSSSSSHSTSPVPSPPPAHVRDFVRSPSPSPSPHISQHSLPPNLPLVPTQHRITPKSSTVTMCTASTSYSADQSGISPGGSIIGGYDPDPFQPLPRRFESLSSYPLSPGQQRESQFSLVERNVSSADTLACIPIQRGQRITSRGVSAAWTLESYHSALEDPTTTVHRSSPYTPKGSERRPAPPPPLPRDLPLPPTPTLTRGESPWDWAGKDSSELLIGDRDWIQIESGSEGINGWGESGRGAGIVGLVGVISCYVLDLPLLIYGPSTVHLSLFLIALFIPAPLLALTSYLLRYRIRKSSNPTPSSHRSLALISNSQLSLPITVSPKLTPPVAYHNHHTTTQPNTRFSKLIVPQPSTSDFGLPRTPRPSKRHTIYGIPVGDPYERDMKAEEAMRRTMARRSADVWIEVGHAKEGMGIWARAAEMLKPFPAMRVIDSTITKSSTLTRLRGGVVSMMPTRRLEDMEMGEVRITQPTISITSPSKYDRARSSYISTTTDDAANDQDHSLPHAEIQMATRARRSGSPSFIFANSSSSAPDEGMRQRHQSYDIDWLSAEVIPALLPNVKIGPEVRVQPVPKATEGDVRPSFEHAITSTPGRGKASHSRGYSSSIDFSRSPDDSLRSNSPKTPRVRQRKHQTLSMPNIVVPEPNSHSGIDLPPIPQALTRSNALTTLIEDTDSTRQAAYEANQSIERNAALARRFLGESSLRTASIDLTNSPSPSFISDAAAATKLLANERSTSTLNSKKSYRLDTDTEPPTSPGSSLGIRPRDDTFGVGVDNQALLRPISTVSRESGWADDADEDYQDEEEKEQWLDGREPALASSLASADEAGAEEMEAVLAMDTPTRAEFVISPPPPSTVSAITQTPSSMYTTTSYMYTDSEFETSPPPPIPSIPSIYRGHASHPHPPPLLATMQKNNNNSSSLAHRSSSESIQSEAGYAVSDAVSITTSISHPVSAPSSSESNTPSQENTRGGPDRSHGFPPAFNPTCQQLARVQRLRERIVPDIDQGKPAVATGGRGLRPLQLVTVAQQQYQVNPNRGNWVTKNSETVQVGLKGSSTNSTNGKVSTGSGRRQGTAAGKENTPAGKKSKASTASGAGGAGGQPTVGIRA